MTTCIFCMEDKKDGTCISNLDKLISIETNLKINISEMIYFATNINLKFIIGMYSICAKCESQAVEAYKFKQMCIDAELRQLEHIKISNKKQVVELEPDIKTENNDMDISETFITNLGNKHELQKETASPPAKKRLIPKNDKVESIILVEGISTSSDDCTLVSDSRDPLSTNISVQNSEINTDNKVASTKEKDIAKYKCSVCKKSFNGELNLSSHFKVYHPSAVNKMWYTCPHCPRKFGHPSNLNAHIRIHVTYKCTLCPFTNISKISFSNHVNLKHPELNTFKCFLCEFATWSEASLNNHSRMHQDKARQFQCNQKKCNFKASTKKSLEMHVALMHEKNRFICDICDKIFWQSSELEKHAHLHTQMSD